MRAVRLFVLLVSLLGLSAQAQRDPTVPPLLGGAGAPARAPAARNGWAVIVVDGQPRLAVDTRLYAEGQRLGAARIERITETEVWLREGGALRKLPIYPGVRRTSLPPAQP